MSVALAGLAALRSMLRARRGFALALLLTALAWGGDAVGVEARRPNVLFCISEDQSGAHTSVAGAAFLSTPSFDRVAAEGVRLPNTFVSAPSCAPSRAAILTGQPFYRSGSLAAISSRGEVPPDQFPSLVDLLARGGYAVGATGKTTGPGAYVPSGRRWDAHGSDLSENFRDFLKERPKDRPFFFWVGDYYAHRPYRTEGYTWETLQSGVFDRRLARVEVPPFLPDGRPVRADLLGYALAIEAFDARLGRLLSLLDRKGLADDTLVVVTSDHGMAFPRAKANLYDAGTRVPLAIRWPRRIAKGRVLEDLVSAIDLAPTIVEAAGLSVPGVMLGKSLMPLLTGEQPSGSHRDHVISGIERHAPGSRTREPEYPSRALRTRHFLYIRNYMPERWPAGDPVGRSLGKPISFGDVDPGAAKNFMLTELRPADTLYRLAFGKRPAQELYDLKSDPQQLLNVADDPRYATQLAELSARLDSELRRTGDLRALGRADEIVAHFADPHGSRPLGARPKTQSWGRRRRMAYPRRPAGAPTR